MKRLITLLILIVISTHFSFVDSKSSASGSSDEWTIVLVPCWDETGWRWMNEQVYVAIKCWNNKCYYKARFAGYDYRIYDEWFPVTPGNYMCGNRKSSFKVVQWDIKRFFNL